MNGATPSGPSVLIEHQARRRGRPPAPSSGQALEPAQHRGDRVRAHVLAADADEDREHDRRRDERRRLAPRREQPLDHLHRRARTSRRGRRSRRSRRRGTSRCRPTNALPRPARSAAQPAARRSSESPTPWIAAPDDERPRGPVPEAAEQHRQHQVAVRHQPALAVAARAGCRGSRAASARASCASGARSPAARRPCTARRSSAGTGTRAAARRRSRCSCSRRSRRRSGRRSRRRRPAPRATSAGSARRRRRRRCAVARWFAITTFRKRPLRIRTNARRDVDPARIARPLELREQLARADDRAGDEVREERLEDREARERGRDELAAVDVDDVRDRHERVEGDPDRQRRRARSTTIREPGRGCPAELTKKFAYLK